MLRTYGDDVTDVSYRRPVPRLNGKADIQVRLFCKIAKLDSGFRRNDSAGGSMDRSQRSRCQERRAPDLPE